MSKNGMLTFRTYVRKGWLPIKIGRPRAALKDLVLGRFESTLWY